MPDIARGLLLTVLALLLATPAGAAAPLPPQGVPDAVARVFADETLAWANQNESKPGTSPSGGYSAVGPIHEVFAFTTDFLEGDTSETPIRSLNQWQAALLTQGRPAAVATVAMEEGAFRTVTVSTAADQALALAAESTGYVVLGSPAIGTWILSEELILTPSDSWARQISPGPIALAQARPQLAEGWRSQRGTGLPMWLLVSIGVIGLAGTLTTMAFLRRPPGPLRRP